MYTKIRDLMVISLLIIGLSSLMWALVFYGPPWETVISNVDVRVVRWVVSAVVWVLILFVAAYNAESLVHDILSRKDEVD